MVLRTELQYNGFEEHTMSVEELKQAMSNKVAAAPGGVTIMNNENETQKGIGNVYPPPAGRAPGTLDALWGDKPAEGSDGYPDVYSTAVMREGQETRGEMLKRLFDSLRTSAPAEQALMRGALAHANDGTPHSPVLQYGRLRPKTASDETLTDAVMRVVGHI